MMNDRLNCEIMSDLLPLYLDKKTSEETNGLIRQHLAGCESCTRLTEVMSVFPEELLVEKPPEKKKRKKRIKMRIFLYAYGVIMLLLWVYMFLDMVCFFVWGW